MTDRLWPQSLLENPRTRWAMAAIIALLLGISNLPWQLDDYDQAKQAFTSYQMVNDGRWFYQTLPHERIATKPPLVGWISAGFFEVSRSWELAWRLPSILAAAFLAIMLYRLGRTAYGELAGLLCTAAFGLNLITPRLATLVRTDMPLALAIFVIGALIWNKIRRQEPWQPNDRLILFLALTAGMLIKGPVVWAFVVPGILAYRFWARDSAPRMSGGLWPWILSLLIFVGWVAGGIVFIPGFYDQVVVHEFLGRFGGEAHRAQPALFYVGHLIHKFAPWSLLMIGIGILQFGFASWKWRKINISPSTRWLICWSIGGLVVMSLLPSKRVDRIFPVIPPLCLLLGAQISALLSSTRVSKVPVYQTALAAVGFAIVFTGSYFIWKVKTGYEQHRDGLAQFGKVVRNDARVRGWRYAVVSSADEGLLLYLRRNSFVLPDRAASEWNSSQVDALVVSTGDAPALLDVLKPPPVTISRSGEKSGGSVGDYLFIAKHR